MRRLWIAFVALVLLSGCTNHSSPAQNAASKQAFVRQLVGYCADVDRHLATVDQPAAPGQTAAQLAKFASQARSHPPPNAQRDQFDTLLTTIDQAVQQFRAAQAALSSGHGNAYRADLMRATQTMTQADKAAVRYGMPHLASCPQAEGAPKPTTVAQPAAGWHLASDSKYATLEVGAAVDKNGRIWVAGGLTGSHSATTNTEFYDPTTRVWSPGPDLPVALHHAMMVSYQNTVWVIGGLEVQGSEVSGIASARVLRLNEAEGLLGRRPGAASCAWRRRGGGGGEQDRRGRRADRRHRRHSRAGRPDHGDLRRHQLARRRAPAGSGRSPGGRVGREVRVRRRRAQAECQPPIPRRCSASTRSPAGGPCCRPCRARSPTAA